MLKEATTNFTGAPVIAEKVIDEAMGTYSGQIEPWKVREDPINSSRNNLPDKYINLLDQSISQSDLK